MSIILREKVNVDKVSYLLETYTFNVFKETYTGTATAGTIAHGLSSAVKVLPRTWTFKTHILLF